MFLDTRLEIDDPKNVVFLLVPLSSESEKGTHETQSHPSSVSERARCTSRLSDRPSATDLPYVGRARPNHSSATNVSATNMQNACALLLSRPQRG